MTTTTAETPVPPSPDDVPAGPLGRFGVREDLTASRTVSLVAEDCLWLVEVAPVDVFAVADEGRGRWHFIARAEPGTLLLGDVVGARHRLVVRPLLGGQLRRLPVAELVAAEHAGWRDRPGAGSAVVAGVDAGIDAVGEVLRTELPPREFVALDGDVGVELQAGQRARSVDGVLWVLVLQGSVTAGGIGGGRAQERGELVALGEQDWVRGEAHAVLRGRPTAELLAEGTLWAHLATHQAALMTAVDARMTELDAGAGEQLAAGRAAGAAALERARRALSGAVDPQLEGAGGPLAHAGAEYAAARMVASAAGIHLEPPARDDAVDNRVDPLERIALGSRFRTRPVRLEGSWWRQDVGPLLAHRREDRSPVALLWRAGGYVLADPVTGRRTRVRRALAETLEPDAAMFYRPLPDRPVTGWNLIRFGLAGARWDVPRFLVGGLVAVALALAVPVATGKVLGEFVPRAEPDLIVPVCTGLLVAGVVAAAFSVLENLAVLRMEGRFEAVLQAAVWDRLLRLPTTFFGQYSTGELSSAALGISTIREVLSGVTATALHAVLTAAVSLLLLFWYSPQLGAVAALLVVGGGAVCVALGMVQIRWQSRLVELDHKLSSKVFQILTGLPKLRVAAAESFAYAFWADDFARTRRLSRRARRMQNLLAGVNAGFPVLATLTVFALLTGPLLGTMSSSDFLSFNAAFGVLLGATVQFTGSITSAAGVVPMFRKVEPVTAELPEVARGKVIPGELSGSIEVSHVTFGYLEDAPPILDDISFRVTPGEFVAVVGRTGCGKSTLLRLLVGFEQPRSGSILFDGQDLASLDVGAVRRQCGVVLQHGRLFAGNVLSNICGIGTYSIDDAWAAAEMAGIDEDIARMPMGMHTVLSDGAATLSAGQRQRLMIARALIGRPRILFLDEATSALDNETQEIVTESTRKLRATRLVIAHRLSTIMQADRVVVLDTGRVAQIGSPGELLSEVDGLFHQLLRRQLK